MERETRLVSCSLAIDVSPLFAFSGLQPQANRLRTWLARATRTKGSFNPTSQAIKKPHLWWSFFMERETRLELATSSLARRHSTTELPPHCGYSFILHADFFFASIFYYFFAPSLFMPLFHTKRAEVKKLLTLFTSIYVPVSKNNLNMSKHCIHKTMLFLLLPFLL